MECFLSSTTLRRHYPQKELQEPKDHIQQSTLTRFNAQFSNYPNKSNTALFTPTMSEQYKNQDLLDIAAKAEQDLASQRLKQGAGDGGFGGKTIPGGSVSSMSRPLHRRPFQ